MYRAARALVIKASKESLALNLLPDLSLDKLADFGIKTEVVHAGKAVDFSNIDQLPDVVILDVSATMDASVMADYSRRLQSSQISKILPIVMVGWPSDFSLFDVHLHLDHRSPAHVIARKLKHLIRAAAMKLEYARRIETAHLFNVSAPKLESLESNSSERLLVIGKGERYFQLARVFEGTATLKSAANFNDAIALLERSAFDCLIIDTVAFSAFQIQALKDFKLDARFFCLPVLLLQEGLTMDEQEVLVETGICDLFDLHGEAREIATHAKTLIHGERLRRKLLAAFKSPGFNKIRDQSTNLPSRNFFERHLDKLVRQSQAWNTPIAFGMLDIAIPFSTGTNDEPERHAAIFGQIGQTIASLVRAEDIATHLGGGKFVIAAPNSTELTISVLIGRISAVLAATDFSVGGELGKVEVTTSYFTSQPQDSLTRIMQGLIAA